MKSFCIIFVVFLTLECTNGANFSCFNFVPGTKPKTPLPPFPTTYKVIIEIVNSTEKDADKHTSYDVLELFDDAKKTSTIRRTENEGRFQWIFNHTSKIYSYIEQDFSCNTSVWEKNSDIKGAPLLFPQSVLQTTEKPVISLSELYEHFKLSASVVEDTNNADHDHGIPDKHYIGCSNISGVYVEFEVCLSEKNFSMPDKNIKEVPTRIELKVYTGANATNVTVMHYIVYEMTSYRSKLIAFDNDMFLPNYGVFCKGMNNTKEIPKLPSKFSVKIEYVDFPTSSVDSNQLFYDDVEHVAAFDFTTNYTDEPMANGLNLTKGHYRIVHDFKSGLQYVVDSTKDTCTQVSGIPWTAGDVDGPTDNVTIGMKSIINTLMTPETSSFVYVGMRMSNNMPCDVWVARINDSKPDEYKIYELWMMSSNWSTDNGFGVGQKNLPVMLRVYHGENANRTRTSQHFHDYKIYDGPTTPMPWNKLDVLPCLSFVQEYSYLVVEMTGTEEMLKKVGYEVVKNTLREKLAEKANVTELRITEFYFQPVPNGLWVFFMLANRSDATPSKTKWFLQEIDVAKAHENLNASLTAGDIKFDIGSVKFSVNKGSLNLVPPFFHPSNVTVGPPPATVQSGYTSGSMAGLGICMLLIGGIVGLGLAFFLWKRNRGIAYQIYE